MTFGSRLFAPEPGWTTESDVIVVGSGIAGLSTALELRSRGNRVLLVTKSKLSSGSTVWAQGGIAAALAPSDSPRAHFEDTLEAGGGVCDPRAVEVLVTEGPARVRELVALGARFDLMPDGDIALTREGGHRADRIAHAGGDATGAEISRALLVQLEAVRNDPGIEIIEHALVLDLLSCADPEGDGQGAAPTAPDAALDPVRDPALGPALDPVPGAVCGVTLHVIGEGARDGVGAARARAVVLATGGIGQMFRASTNPPTATGDGSALALRAGAVLGDFEFVQFHPTVLMLGAGVLGQLPLISEALRGEGARLVNSDGARFMLEVHSMAELAPRDVVAHAIVDQLARTGSDHVFLDARHLDADFLRTRFPTINARLLEHGIDFTTDLVPVAPAQHYHSGGIVTDLSGRTNVPGLYAVGEAACTGVHGANRLASNSLLEGLVFAHRAAHDIGARLAAGELPQCEPTPRPGRAVLVPAAARSRIQRIVAQGAGVVRDDGGLRSALSRLDGVSTTAHEVVGANGRILASAQVAEWETTNLHQLATVLTRAALLRTESRGGHFRRDFPAQDPAWANRIEASLDVGGELVLRTRHLPREFGPLTGSMPLAAPAPGAGRLEHDVLPVPAIPGSGVGESQGV